MNLLVVEGNEKKTRDIREAFGIMPYHLLFQKMLYGLVPGANVEFAFPADGMDDLPSLDRLKDYDGVLWTGSSLSVLEEVPAVWQQLNFGEDVFKSGVSFYGSCWGLQVAVLIAGGKVGKSKNGLEIGISSPINLTKEGFDSPFFTSRINNYQSLCIHYDEVVASPQNAIILANNDHSKIQALTFQYKNSDFFGVQYHPEFNPSLMAQIITFLSSNLVESGPFKTKSEVLEFAKSIASQVDLPQEIISYNLHTQEIGAWLKQLRS